MSRGRALILQGREKKGRSGVRLSSETSGQASLGRGCHARRVTSLLPCRPSSSVFRFCSAVSVDSTGAELSPGGPPLGTDAGAEAWGVGWAQRCWEVGREFQAQRSVQLVRHEKLERTLTHRLLSRYWQLRLVVKLVSLIHCHFLPVWNWSFL